MSLTFLRRILFAACGAYLSLVMAMMILETRLVYPAPPARDVAPKAGEREFTCQSADGATVHGWILEGLPNRPAIVVFHGNAEDVPRVARDFGREMCDQFEATVLVFDFRWYGRTSGIPDEKSVLDDGEAMVRAFATELKTNPDQLVFFGRSLGGGLATGVADRTGAGMLILDRTFDALDCAAAANYPWIPTRLVMCNHFRSDLILPRLTMPLFQSHFVNDEITPLPNAERLFGLAASPVKTFVRLDKGTHLSDMPDEWWNQAKAFLDLHAPKIQ